MKKNSINKKKKSNKFVQPFSDLPIDNEQIATQNLFNVSDYHDYLHYQKDFNGTFDIFRSINLEEIHPNDSPKVQKYRNNIKLRSLTKSDKKSKANDNQQDNKQLGESKIFIKLYETLPEQNLSRSPQILIKKQRLYNKVQKNSRRTLLSHSFKSDSVFVGKKPIRSYRNSNQNRKHLLDLLIQKSIGNSPILNKQQKQKTQKHLAQLTLYSPNKKLWVNDIRIENKKSFSPQLKSKIIFPQFSAKQKLESLSAVKPLSKTTLYPCSQFKKSKKEENQFSLKKKLSQNNRHQFSKNMRLNESIGPYESRYNTGKKRRSIF